MIKICIYAISQQSAGPRFPVTPVEFGKTSKSWSKVALLTSYSLGRILITLGIDYSHRHSGATGANQVARESKKDVPTASGSWVYSAWPWAW
jgi:hypothetical protein